MIGSIFIARLFKIGSLFACHFFLLLASHCYAQRAALLSANAPLDSASLHLALCCFPLRFISRFACFPLRFISRLAAFRSLHLAPRCLPLTHLTPLRFIVVARATRTDDDDERRNDDRTARVRRYEGNER